MHPSDQHGAPFVCKIPSGAKLEFAPDHVRFIPNRLARMTGQSPEEAAISPQSAEILLCHRYWQERPNGWRVIVRAANGDERELAEAALLYLRARDVDTLARSISPATNLPVRVVIRRTTLHGPVEETPWTPPAARTRILMPIAISAVVLPFVGGILTGWFSPSPGIVIVVGLALWLCLMLALYAAARTDRKKVPLLYSLTTLVTFSATYAVCFVVTSYLAHPH